MWTHQTASHHGHQVPQVSVRGHVRITVVTAPHPVYRRSGHDLNVTLPLTFRQALLGFNVSLQTLDDRTLIIARDTPTSPDTVITLVNEGLPVPDSWWSRGALHVHFTILMPAREWAQKHAGELRKLLR